MMKRIISLAFCMILVLSCFSACGSKGTGKQLVFPIDNEPEYLDPQIVSDVGARNIIANCFEGLVTFNENGEIVPAAAESYKVSGDGLTYTFTLRDDLYWRITTAAKNTIEKVLGENGIDQFDTKITADDFVFGIRRALRPETKSPYAENLMAIRNAQNVNSGKVSETKLGVTAADARTLVISLERPDADLLLTLTTPACMPCCKEFFEYTKGRYGLSTAYLLYNGPFYISNWAEKTAITARKNEKYHGVLNEDGETWISKEPAKPSSIYFSFNNEQATRGRKVKDGTYDAAPLTVSQAEELIKNKKITVKEFDSAVFSMVFNCADESVSNINIRRAIAQSVSLNPLLEATEKKAAAGIIPSSMSLSSKQYRSSASAFTQPVLKDKTAVSLLKKGLEELEQRDIELTVLCEQEHENAVRAMMQQWQSVFGVIFSISVEPVTSETLAERLKSGEYQIALTDIKYSTSSAFDCVARYTSGSRDNFVNLNQKKYDAIIKKYRKAKNEAAKLKVLEEAESYLISCSVIIPIYETASYCGIAKNVSGLVFSPSGDVVYFKDGIRK
ncbi:MAG: peptide ABC transporter substrate-binding protein [Faecalibacterium sp.]|nr:peptide ABC transporter substrate-binding protein [Ruminococcus sp.]MCM1392831.1 peptide ABC transporter substrate-binding protein [Ruminococcus sp.]MCM1485695.1 peptide ABC transporter substrate-binding protein [Faecalibacterium sp.]